MCYRQVQCTRYGCGHDTPLSEHRSFLQVDCSEANCRYSSSHLADCQSCKETCRQWLRPAQMVPKQTLSTPCPHCASGAK
ncbi:hypothetical protein BDN72DRAFT_480244 [Pluteus cervinus]|uniref:Uncharacterized protein n=1 Tax=Pluteus cervinus TaxID=181527 RepID=A0ACD3B0K2_9AGAR|nr:hypothetical protein BDN72DRAFT_480244 [Pluteus cervinus]